VGVNEREEMLLARPRPAADPGEAALRMGDKLWDRVGNGTGTGLCGLPSPRGWRLLAAPGVPWRLLTSLVRLYHRYALDLVAGMQRDGLALRKTL
jgi:hypothetical protein